MFSQDVQFFQANPVGFKLIREKKTIFILCFERKFKLLISLRYLITGQVFSNPNTVTLVWFTFDSVLLASHVTSTKQFYSAHKIAKNCLISFENKQKNPLLIKT